MNCDREFIAILEQIRVRIRRRQIQMRLEQMSVWWLAIGVVILFLHRLNSSLYILSSGIFVGGCVLLYTCVALCRNNISMAAVAFHLDQDHRLDNRVSSAYHLICSGRGGGLSNLLIADSCRRLRDISTSNCIPAQLEPKKWRSSVALLLCLSCVYLLLTPIEQNRDIISTRHRRIFKAAAHKIAAVAEDLAKTSHVEGDKELHKIAARWRRKELSSISEEIEHLEQVADSLRSAQLSKTSVAETMQLGDISEAALVEKLASLSPQKRVELAREIEKSTSYPLSSKFAQALSEGNVEQAKQMWQRLPRTSQQRAVAEKSREIRRLSRRLRQKLGLRGGASTTELAAASPATAMGTSALKSATQEENNVAELQHRPWMQEIEKAWWPKKYRSAVAAYFRNKHRETAHEDEK